MKTKEEISKYKKEWRIKDKAKHPEKYTYNSEYRRGQHPNSKIGNKNGHSHKIGCKCGVKKGVHSSIATEFKKGEERITGKNNKKWKGENSSYVAKHQWVRRHFGKPNRCEHCKSVDKKNYHWANISNKYKHDIRDWLRLCVSCHKKYDIKRKKDTTN